MELLAGLAGLGVMSLLFGAGLFVMNDLSSVLKSRSESKVEVQKLKVEEARLKLEETREVRMMNTEAAKLTEAEAELLAAETPKPPKGEDNCITT